MCNAEVSRDPVDFGAAREFRGHRLRRHHAHPLRASVGKVGFARDGGKGSYMHMVDEGSSLPDARETWGDKELEMYDEDASAAYSATVASWNTQGWTFDFATATPATPYLAWGFAVEGVAGSPPAPTSGRRRMMVIG